MLGPLLAAPLVALPLLAVGCADRTVDPGPLHVAAASSLARAFVDAGAAYRAQTGREVVFSFGSSGAFAAQIHEGAPFDLFAAADVRSVDEVLTGGRCRPDTRAIYARGRLAVVARPGDVLPASLADLGDPRFVRIAIANPEHAPYGLAARQALESAGLWDAVGPRLVFGQNILQARQLAASGNAEVAIVALSLVGDEPHLAIPTTAHAPIDQELVVCATDRRRDAAVAFATWLRSEPARRILRSHGFDLPGPASGGPAPGAR